MSDVVKEEITSDHFVSNKVDSFNDKMEAFFASITDNIFNFFYELGKYVDANARTVLWVSIGFTLIAGSGWANFESESRPEKLFTPQDAQAIKDKEWVSVHFPATQRFITLYASDDNLIDVGRNAIYDLFDIYEAMRDGTIGTSPNTLSELCVNNVELAPNNCAVKGPLAYWSYSRATFTADTNWVTTMSNQGNVLDRWSSGTNIDPSRIFGGVKRDTNGIITEVKAYKMEWTIKELKITENNRAQDNKALALEEEYTNYVEDKFKKVGSEQIIPYCRFSQSEAISGTFAFDGILTFVSYIIITVVATWILSDPVNPVRSRAKLGPLTVLVVGMSVVASFGIVIAFGVAFNPVVNSVIFVLLGVGVDDSLVVLEHMDKEYENGTKPRLRIPNALAKAGASISLTSFTDFAAFLSGSTTVIPALKYFCIFAAVAIFIDFILQLTLFIAFLRWDEDRIEEGRVACTCCGKPCCCPSHPGQISVINTNNGNNGNNHMDSSLDKQIVDNNKDSSVGIEMTAVATNATDADINDDNANTNVNVITGTNEDENHNKNCALRDPSTVYLDSEYIKDSKMRTFIIKTLPDHILTPKGKWGILAFTLGLFIMSIIGIINLELDFQFTWFIPDGTTAKDAANLSVEYFTGENIPVFVYTKDIDYFNLRNDILDLCTSVGNNENIVTSSVSCWYKEWNDSVPGGVPTTSSTDFYNSLNGYLSGNTGGARYKSFIEWDNETTPTKVVASKLFASFKSAKNAQENIDDMLSIRKTVDDGYPQLKALAFSEPFVFYEGLRVVYSETVRNVIITLIVVYFVCIIFISDIWCATLCTLSVVSVDVCLFGFLYWIGLDMNTVTSINLLLALGLTVDYSAHIAHAYMHVDAPTKNERVIKAYEKIGVSIFNGGVTTFSAILALVGANSYVFTSFFRCFVLIILFGQYFGMIVLPVVLSCVGPDKVFHDDSKLKAELLASDDDTGAILGGPGAPTSTSTFEKE